MKAQRSDDSIDRPIVRSFVAEEWRLYRDLRLAALTDSPDAFGSTLEREGAFGDQEWERRLAAGVASPTELPLVAEHAGRAVGLSWGRIEAASPRLVHLYQMWVSPTARQLGVGVLLLSTVVDWARRSGADTVQLAVTCGNSPAARLYERAGFVYVGEPGPLRPGSALRSRPMQLALGGD